MTKEISYFVKCDRCLERIPGEFTVSQKGIPIAFDTTLLEVDLCGNCHTELSNILEPILRRGVKPAITRTVRSSAHAPGEMAECPDCGGVYKAGGLGVHRAMKHGHGRARHHKPQEVV